MSSITPTWRWRLFLGWAGACAAAGAIGCLAPLFETLGYEFSLLAALVASLGAGHIAACYPDRVRTQRAPFPGARRAALVLYARTLAPGIALAAIPLALSLLNGLRVAPCNISEGLVFYALLPLPAVAFSCAAGLVLGLATPGPRTASLAWVLAYAASLALAIREFHDTPAVSVWGPLFGYFPGVLYDRLVPVGAPLATYRAATLVQIGLMLSIAWWATDPASLRLSFSRVRERPRAAAVPALLAAATVALHMAGPRLGHRTEREDLEKILPSRASVEGLDLFFPAGTDSELVADLTEDAAFALGRVERYLEAPDGDRIAVFFFADEPQKARAIGASSTNVAKPWRSEVYVLLGRPPHRVLRHELAHAVAARLGRGPFRVAASLWGLWPDPGLIEGVAVAAGGPRGELTVHQWAAALERMETLPEPDTLFGMGFLDLDASAAYSAAGSFCDHVVRRHGAAALGKVYGGASWEEATGRSLDDLGESWRAFLRGITLGDRDLAAARHRFDRPSVVRTTCVHEVARLDATAARLSGSGLWDEALSARRRAVDRSGGSPDARMRLLFALASAGRNGEARSAAERIASDRSAGSVRRALAVEILADLDVAEGRRVTAAESFSKLAEESPDDDARRRLQIKAHLAGLGSGDLDLLLFALALRPGPSSASGSRLALAVADAARERPADPYIAYLLARQRFLCGDHAGAIADLERAERIGLSETTGAIALESRMMRAKALFRLGRLDRAEGTFLSIADDDSIREGQRDIARDWAERCAFRAARIGGRSDTGRSIPGTMPRAEGRTQ